MEAAAELLPVPASVFDDDFFRTSAHGVEIGAFDTMDEAAQVREQTHYATAARVQTEETWGAVAEAPVAEVSVRAPSYGGAVAQVGRVEPDELDIPAFLRRGN